MDELSLPPLESGDLLPAMVCSPPGPRSQQQSARLAELEPPGINTLYRGQPGVLWHEALGANVLDVDGNRFIDLTSGFGVAAVGHRHPAVVAAVAEQSRRLLHGLGDAAAHPLRTELAARLREIAPVEDAQTYFAISGADAIEIALKTACLATGRPGILAFEPGYHGLTLGALAATSRAAFRRPFAAHLHPHVTRLPFACPRSRLRRTLVSDPRLGAVLVEPIVGREGVLVPPTGWLRGLADLCEEFGRLLIVDEIFTGFGRTGTLFAVDADGVRPDLLCCGKALAGGLPIGVVLGSRTLMGCWEAPGEARHTATFVAHPLACASAIAVLDILHREALPERALQLGQRVGDRVETFAKTFACLRQGRGRGLLWGLELVDARAAQRLVERCRERGLLLLAGGPDGRVAQIVPPLTITLDQLDTALDLIETALVEIDRELIPSEGSEPRHE